MIDIALSDHLRIAETETFTEKIQHRKFSDIYKKIQLYVYPILKVNPFYGNNIKKLKGDFEGIYRIRLGNWRLFYTIDQKQRLIFILDLSMRKDCY